MVDIWAVFGWQIRSSGLMSVARSHAPAAASTFPPWTPRSPWCPRRGMIRARR